MPQPGEEVWKVHKDGRERTCELRDDDRAGAGVDVQLLEAIELLKSRRCVNAKGARFLAESYRQNLHRARGAKNLQSMAEAIASHLKSEYFHR